MSRMITHLISVGLICTGAITWAFASRPLMTNSELKAPLNPLGINGSPYGQVFAMAMQGPIDTYFDTPTNGIDHDQNPSHMLPEKNSQIFSQSFGDRLAQLLTTLDKASEERTNPKPSSNAQKLYLRRQVEDKLRFAYQLDPSHYGNYNSLHFFLTEPELGTRPQLTESVAKLAEDTIQYCLNQKDDPRPQLTAAGACTNILQLMISDYRNNPKSNYTTAQMRKYLNLMDYSLSRYVTISREWDQNKDWDNLSPQRIQECLERFQFIQKIRATQEQTIHHLEGKSNNQASN
jgi:hypothetical protein